MARRGWLSLTDRSRSVGGGFRLGSANIDIARIASPASVAERAAGAVTWGPIEIEASAEEAVQSGGPMPDLVAGRTAIGTLHTPEPWG